MSTTTATIQETAKPTQAQPHNIDKNAVTVAQPRSTFSTEEQRKNASLYTNKGFSLMR